MAIHLASVEDLHVEARYTHHDDYLVLNIRPPVNRSTGSV